MMISQFPSNSKKVSLNDLKESINFRNIERLKMKGYDGQAYDYTQMRKVYTSQNRNREITQENVKTFG